MLQHYQEKYKRAENHPSDYVAMLDRIFPAG
jgi:hypothetical protein